MNESNRQFLKLLYYRKANLYFVLCLKLFNLYIIKKIYNMIIKGYLYINKKKDCSFVLK